MLFTLALVFAFQEPGFDQEALQKKVDEITPRVAALRGREFKKPVGASVHTPDQFLEFAMKSLEEDYAPGQMQAWSDAYELIGLTDPGTDLLEISLEFLKSQVGGYYDPKTSTFYMISTFNQGGLADIIMAHELTHALDDQYYDLDGMLKMARDLSSDAEFALRAVVEGSGTSLMNLYTAEGVMKGYLELDGAAMMEMMEEQAEQLETMPAFLIMSLALPYLEGNKFLVKTTSALEGSMKKPDIHDLDHAFKNPPLSAEQVLHFEKYWDPEQRDDPTPVTLPDMSAGLGEGWTLRDTDTLGEVACYTVSQDPLPDFSSIEGQLGSWTNEAASGWDGDLYQLYGGPEGQRLLVWAMVWDSVKDRQEFASAFQALAGENPYFRGLDQGADACVAYFSDDGLEEMVERLRKGVERARPDWN